MEGLLIKYEGGDTDNHIIDAIQYSESLRGTGKLYISVAHFCTYGSVLSQRQHSDIRCYATEGKSGCYETAIILGAQVAQLPLFSEIYKPYIEWLVSQIIKYIKDTLTGRGKVEDLATIIAERAKNSEELSHVLANGLLRSNEKMAEIALRAQDIQEALIAKLPELVEANKNNMKKSINPVGKSCNEIKHFSGLPSEFSITEPDAEAIRSKDDLQVDDLKNYQCELITELNTLTGNCHLHLSGLDGRVVGKINDPVLQQADNIYSRALNNKTGFNFRAKAVMKEGKIYRLYVSDADVK